MLEDVIRQIAENTMGLYEEFLSPGDILPMRIGREDFLEVSRKHLEVRDPVIAEEAHRKNIQVEAPLSVDYEVVPFNPSANSKSAQLGRLMQFMQLLLNNPLIDQTRLMIKILELLELGDEMLKQRNPLRARRDNHKCPQIQLREAVFLLESESPLPVQKLWEPWPAERDTLLLPLFRYNILGDFYAYDA